MIRLLEHPPATGAWNMAVDEALMEAARSGGVTLRLYRWDPACLSLGRNERARGRYDAEEAARLRIDVVRRPTGGRAVYHDDELTYAVAAPAGLWGGLRESYARINRALARGLRALGVPADTSAPAERSAYAQPSASPERSGSKTRRGSVKGSGSFAAGLAIGAGACFAAPAPGEVTAAGRKLVGSAQWRHAGALLQHGSILLSDDQATVEQLRAVPISGGASTGASAGGGPAAVARGSQGAAGPTGEGAPNVAAARAAAVGLRELLDGRPASTDLRDALLAGFRAELAAEVRQMELTATERGTARRLEARYRDDDWTWRR